AERLVTVTGAGGSGKTRLSLQVAAELLEEFPGGVFFVALAPLAAPELVRPAILRMIGSRDLGEIADRRVLLLLDNFEHLLPAAGGVAALLDARRRAQGARRRRSPVSEHGEGAH